VHLNNLNAPVLNVLISLEMNGILFATRVQELWKNSLAYFKTEVDLMKAFRSFSEYS